MSTRSRGALFLLCVVQGCERFAFFAMLPLFVLYLHQRHGFTEPAALLLLGVFQALSYFGALPMGMLTDRKLGSVVGTILGATLLTLGYGALALDHDAHLWPALGLMVIGHAFFKPNLNAVASGLLGAHGSRPERSFLWLHLAVNVGGMAGPLCTEWTRPVGGWGGVFLCATAGMFIGAFLLAFGSSGLMRPRDMGNPGASVSSSPDSAHERSRAVWLICGVALILWLTAQQAGSSLPLFAEAHTQQTVFAGGLHLSLGPGHFASLHALLVLLLLPLSLWDKLPCRKAETSTPAKMISGYLFTTAAFVVLGAACLHGGDTGRVSVSWLTACYVLLSVAEVQLAPLGLALITRLAPTGHTSRAIGLWFASMAIGNGLVGLLGLLWGYLPNHSYFALLAILSLAAAGLLVARRYRLETLIARLTPAAMPVAPDARVETESLTELAIAPSLTGFVLATVAILVPGAVLFMTWLPLPIQAVSAILCGLAVLLCGPVLIGRAIDGVGTQPVCAGDVAATEYCT